MNKSYCTYILTNSTRSVLYIGVTNDLARRVYEHKTKAIDGFTKKYHCTYLVCYEIFAHSMEAIEREKQLKSWTRAKKNALIERTNPIWEDLSTSL